LHSHLGVDDIVDITFAFPLDGAMDTFVVKSDTTWTDLRFKLADQMVKPASKLNLGYKFSTDARNLAPNRLANGVNLVDLIEGARDGLIAYAEAKAKPKGKKPKPFRVEIVDLDAGKDKDKARKANKEGKHKKKVRQLLPIVAEECPTCH
jgi:hypothetical protein